MRVAIIFACGRMKIKSIQNAILAFMRSLAISSGISIALRKRRTHVGATSSNSAPMLKLVAAG